MQNMSRSVKSLKEKESEKNVLWRRIASLGALWQRLNKRNPIGRQILETKTPIDISASASLPEEMLVDIFMRLPVKSLLRFKCVSKYWLSLITSPDLVKQHLAHGIRNNPRIIFIEKLNKGTTLKSLEYEVDSIAQNYQISLPFQASLIGSCNGLVCLSDQRHYAAVCNPATREYIMVPFDFLEPLPARSTRYFGMGFGYDPLTEKYKLFRVDYIVYEENPRVEDCKMHVYTFGTDTWRRIKTPFCLHFDCSSMPHVNGALHSFELSKGCKCCDNPVSIDSIISFNVGSENFQKVPWDTDRMGLRGLCHLGVLHECLAINHSSKDGKFVDIWVMKEYGVGNSWTKLFFIYYPDGVSSSIKFRPIVTYRNGEILLESESSKATSIDLHAYNLESRSSRYYRTVKGSKITAYVESLVPIPVKSQSNRER